MRHLVAAVVSVAGMFVIIGIARSSAQAQVPQTCGPGIVLRAEGSVIIDAYTIYPMQFPGSMPGQVNPNPAVNTKPGPVSITLGKSLPDDLPLCVESSAGSRCQNLSVIRGSK